MRKETKANPFVPITRGWLAVLVTYGLLYEILTPGLREILFDSGAPLSGWRTLASIVYQLLLFAPLFLYRRRFGWLHPLIFPLVFSMGMGLLKDPSHLLAPLALFQEPVAETLTHPELPWISAETMAAATLESQLYNILAVLCYYAGFFFEQRFRLVAPRLPRVKFAKPARIALVARWA